MLPPAQISIPERLLLSKGLKYIPYIKYTNTHHQTDIVNLKSKLIEQCSDYRYDLPKQLQKEQSGTSQIQSDVNKTIERFVIAVDQTRASSNQSYKRDNLTRKERQALNSLKKKNLVIKKSDKGDIITVETKETYVADGLEHLSDKNVYQQVNQDINTELHQKIQKFVQHCYDRGLINTHTFVFLNKERDVRTPVIYFLKKLHKDPVTVRPIVSNINSPTCLLSTFMDGLLRPIVERKPHILKDSIQVIREIENMYIPEHSILITADVKSLYPSIPTDESIDIILAELEKQKDPTYPPLRVIKQFLIFILKYNCFNFVDSFFLQVRGVAMGTTMAPNYANLFMSYLEETFIFNQPLQPLYYRRYIDDVLAIWPHSETQLSDFQQRINQVHSTIKFTFETSSTEVNYLDIKVLKCQNKCYVKPYFKPTNSFSYVLATSYHPRSTFKGIYRGENIRILRNCSKEEDYIHTISMLQDKFKSRGYGRFIEEISNIPFTERSYWLYKPGEKPTSQEITFTSYFDCNKHFLEALKEHWPILSANEVTRRKLFTKPVKICYTNHPSIKNTLVRAKISGTINTNQRTLVSPAPIIYTKFPSKNIKCRTTNCSCCDQLKESHDYVSFQTSKRYTIPKIFSCDSTNVIYLLECSHCFKQYIGETHTKVSTRMRHHRKHSKTHIDRPIYAHLKKHGLTFSTYKLTIIREVRDTTTRKTVEKELIQELKTKIPFGFNVIKS